MDWMAWYFAVSPYVPYSPGLALDGKCLPDDLDTDVIAVLYLVIANETKCSECGHLLGRRLRVGTAGIASEPRWPVKVRTKCWGWRRHRHVAAVTRPSNDLLFGDLKLVSYDPANQVARAKPLEGRST